jgi:hypothetical protein
VGSESEHPSLEHNPLNTTRARTAREPSCRFGNVLLVAVDRRRFKTLLPTRMHIKIFLTRNPCLWVLLTKYINHRTSILRALIIGLE